MVIEPQSISCVKKINRTVEHGDTVLLFTLKGQVLILGGQAQFETRVFRNVFVKREKIFDLITNLIIASQT